MSPEFRKICYSFLFWVIGVLVLVPTPQAAAATLTVDGSQQYQTMDGFGVNINANQWGQGNFTGALERLVNELGSSLIRLYIDNTDWEAQNDNNDPNTFNDAYFNAIFTSPRMERLWSTWSYLNQLGITDGIVLNFMGWAPDWMGGHVLPEDPVLEAEFVETIVAVVRYGVLNRGLKLGWLAPFNEPNWNCQEGTCVNEDQMPRLVRMFGERLRELGIDAQIVAPDTSSNFDALYIYMPPLADDSDAMQYLGRWGIHNYGGDSGGIPEFISQSSQPDLGWWVTEWALGSGDYLGSIGTLINLVGDGANAAFVFRGHDGQDNHHPPGEDYSLGLLQYNSSNGEYTPRKLFWSGAQIFRFVRPGAKRIRLSEFSGSFEALAFYHPLTQQVTIIGYTNRSVQIDGNLQNLPPISTLESYHSTAFDGFERQADITASGNTFSVNIGGNEVFTLVAPGAVDDNVPPTISITSPTPGDTVKDIITVAAVAADDKGVISVQFSVDNSVLGAPDTTFPFSVSFNTVTVANGPHTLAAEAVDGGGNKTTAEIDIEVLNETDTQAPVVNITAPLEGQVVADNVLFEAQVVENTSVASVTFYVDEQAVGNVTNAPYRLNFDSSSVADGSHSLTAVARDAAGNEGYSEAINFEVNNSDIVQHLPGLVAAYGFDEGGGSRVFDSSAGSHDGTIQGAAWSADGRYGSALSFDGINDQVVIADAAALDLSTGMTLMAWVNPDTAAGWRNVLMKESNSGLCYSLYASDDTGRRGSVYINTVGADRSAIGPTLPANTWSHLTATYDGSRLILFVNGNQVASTSVSGSLVQSSRDLLIGGNNIWGEHFSGLIDEVRIYSRALSPSEIIQIRDTPVDSPGEEAPDTTAPDVSLTSPQDGTVVAGMITISANASDDTAVAGVSFELDGTPLGEITSPPYELSWDSSTVSNGSHSLTAVARDAAGNQAGTGAVGIVVHNADTTAPNVSLVSPQNGAVVAGTITLEANASDDTAVAGVSFELDGTPLGEVTSPPYELSWDSSSVADGSHSLTAVARDAAGNQANTPVVGIVVQNADMTAPEILSVLPPTGMTGVNTDQSVSVTFSEAMDAATFDETTFELLDAADMRVAAGVSYNSTSHTATLGPADLLVADTTYTVVVHGGTGGVTDIAGNPLESDYIWSFTTEAGSSPVFNSLWDDATIPNILSDSDTNAVELGMKFQSNVDGFITALRFYKGRSNTGTHVGSLWATNGTLLARVTFTNESSSGWQVMPLPAPVAIKADTTYVVSYHTNVGRYSADVGYFYRSDYNNPPLRALADGENGGNGVYRYGAGGFPNQNYRSTNYWVDVVFKNN